MALCERRIGKELIEGRERGEIFKRGDTGGRPSLKIDDSNFQKSTLADLGLTANQSSDYQTLARAPEGVIHETVEKANAENRPVSKTEIERAAKTAAPKPGRGPASTRGAAPKRRRASPKLRVVPAPEDARRWRKDQIDDGNLIKATLAERPSMGMQSLRYQTGRAGTG